MLHQKRSPPLRRRWKLSLSRLRSRRSRRRCPPSRLCSARRDPSQDLPPSVQHSPFTLSACRAGGTPPSLETMTISASTAGLGQLSGVRVYVCPTQLCSLLFQLSLLSTVHFVQNRNLMPVLPRFLCTPRWPYPWMCGSSAKGRPPPGFFPLDEKMAFIPAAVLGFQHMIAALIGLITPAQARPIGP